MRKVAEKICNIELSGGHIGVLEAGGRWAHGTLKFLTGDGRKRMGKGGFESRDFKDGAKMGR